MYMQSGTVVTTIPMGMTTQAGYVYPPQTTQAGYMYPPQQTTQVAYPAQTYPGSAY